MLILSILFSHALIFAQFESEDTTCVDSAIVLKEAPPTVQEYTCNFGTTPTSEKPKGVLTISAFEDNDNMFMGLGMVLMDSFDGNDLGFTHALGMNATYSRGKNEYYFDAYSGLYTQTVRGIYHRPGMAPYSAPASYNHQGTSRSDDSVRFIDANKFTVGMKHGKDFYVKGSLGYEIAIARMDLEILILQTYKISGTVTFLTFTDLITSIPSITRRSLERAILSCVLKSRPRN